MPEAARSSRASGQRLIGLSIGALMVLALLIVLPSMFASTQPSRSGTAESTARD